MVQDTKGNNGGVSFNVRTMYAVGIAGNVLISIAHIAYAFTAYKTIDEPALWFFSGAITVIFNAALNYVCFEDLTKFNFVTCMVSNVALVIFTVALTIVVKEAHTICVATIISYTTILCYKYNKQMRN